MPNAPRLPPFIYDLLLNPVHPLVDIYHGEVRDDDRDYDHDGLDDPRLLQASCRTPGQYQHIR